jgi:hypothetical protein
MCYPTIRFAADRLRLVLSASGAIDRDRLYRLQLQAIVPTLWGQREPAIIAAPL